MAAVFKTDFVQASARMLAGIEAFATQYTDSRFQRSREFLIDDSLRIYVRVGYGPFYHGCARRVLCIANVVIHPAHQRQGWFSYLLERLEQIAKSTGHSAIEVQQIVNKDLASSLLRKGYSEWRPETRFDGRNQIPTLTKAV